MTTLYSNEEIPEEFSDDEKIIRGIFYPANFNKKTDEVRENMFLPPPGSDELSVIRLKYSSANRCKFHCKKIQREKRNYWGMGVLNKTEIYSISGCILVKSPKEYENYFFPEHADIKLPFSRSIKPNDPLPIEDDFIIEQLFKIAKIKQDPNSDEDDWSGENL